MKLEGILVTDKKAMVENEFDGLLNPWMIWNPAPFGYRVGIYVDVSLTDNITDPLLAVTVWLVGPGENDVREIRKLKPSQMSKLDAGAAGGATVRLGFDYKLEVSSRGEYAVVAGLGTSPQPGDQGWLIDMR